MSTTIQHNQEYTKLSEDLHVNMHICMESYPCQHLVQYKGKNTRMFGDRIAKILSDNALEIPDHFRGYITS